jgi:hypothetical protein
LDSAQGLSNNLIWPKAFLVILDWSFGLVILTDHFGWSFLLVIVGRTFLVIENCILTQILAQSQWRYYQQLIVGIIFLIVKII